MIVHVAPDVIAKVAARPELQLGGVRFTRKAEHHFTVLNYGIGKHVAKLVGAKPELRHEIDDKAASWAWELSLSDVFYHLVQDTPGKPRLQTIVVLANAAIAPFYAWLRARVAEIPEAGALAEGLATPPPPHVTLYTSDPEGRQGIGLNRVAELEDAIKRASANPDEGAPGLRAYRLHHDLVC